MGNFEFDGQKYKKASTHQKEWGNKIITELTVNGTESILDLGCGDGILTKQLAELAPKGQVLGIDASPGMIGTAQELAQANLSFRLLDIDHMDFENEYDLIFSNAALHWVKDHQRLLQNCYRALKPNGFIRFNFAGDGNCANFYEIIKQVMAEPPYQDYFRNFEWPWFMPKINEYINLISGCGFKNLRVWEENADRYFKNKDEMIGWIDQPSIVPFIKLINIENKENFRNEVIQRMIAKTIQLDGTCFETFRRINVLAYR